MAKIARILLVSNGLIALFSIAGFGAFVNGAPVPAWDYYLLTRSLTIANVVSGVLCAMFAMASEQGWRATLTLLMLAVIFAGTAELIGTITGFPFGHYRYTDLLGYKLFGHVPVLIPPSWFMMLYPALHLASLRLHGWIPQAAMASVILTLWDVALDPAVTTGFAQWQWHQKDSLWGWLPRIHFYGMPLENWIGWLLTGGLISMFYLRLQPNWKPARNSLAVWLYPIQSGFVVTMALLLGRWVASLLWLVGAAGLLWWLKPWITASGNLSAEFK